LFGLLAAVTGIRVGRKMLKQPVQDLPESFNKTSEELPRNGIPEFNYSISWLFINISLIICSFILLGQTTWIVWSLAITGIVVIWSVRYKRALRQLSKPKFWILFVFITLVTAFVFTEAQPGENSLLKGLMAGVQMNFRAVLIIVGFSVLGTELYNPVVRNFFLKTSFKNLPLALELSAESLPSFIANIPDLKTLIRNPVSIFYQVISQADRRLAEIKNITDPTRKVFIITGAIGEGKTTYIKKLIGFFRMNDIAIGGILSERSITDAQTTGYDLVNIETGEKEVFLRQNEKCGTETIGRFTICSKGITMGNTVLRSLISPGNKIVIIDEVGLLELQNKGWAAGIDGLLKESKSHILFSVRDIYLNDIKTKWSLREATTFYIRDTDYKNAGRSILEQINFQSVL
jgi:nucleoside-triphosphatase THEP1